MYTYGKKGKTVCTPHHIREFELKAIVLGCVTDEQYRMLTADYTAEPKALEKQILERENRLETLKASAANVAAFVEKAKRYTEINELTSEF